MYMFFSQYEYDLHSIPSLIVSANQLAMCTCIIIAVLIYHDVSIQILPSISISGVARVSGVRGQTCFAPPPPSKKS